MYSDPVTDSNLPFSETTERRRDGDGTDENSEDVCMPDVAKSWHLAVCARFCLSHFFSFSRPAHGTHNETVGALVRSQSFPANASAPAQ